MHRFPKTLARRTAAFVLLAASLVAAAPAAADEVRSAAPWSGREAFLETALREGEVLSMKRIGEGITNPWKVELAYADERLAGIFKPLERGRYEYPESYESEVAAYRLSEALGIGMVPPTVVRKIGRRTGSLQFWVTGYRSFVDAIEESVPPGRQWIEQIERMRLFDELIDNPDRNGRNYLVDEEWNIVLIDHSRALNFDVQGTLRDDPDPVRFDPTVIERLRALDEQALEVLLGDLLSKRDLRHLLRARDRVLSLVDLRAAELGPIVFFDPAR